MTKTDRRPTPLWGMALLILICAYGPHFHSNLQAQSGITKNQNAGAPTRSAQAFSQTNTKPDSPFGSSAKYKTVATNLRQFGVPFQINAADDSFIEVQLYLSRDQGKTWRFQGRQATDQQEFPFEADADGEYWFSLKTLNRDRKLVPDGDPEIDLSIIVDTVKPTLDFRIETDAAGRIVCRWRAMDKNLATDTMRIFYQPTGSQGASKAWTQVPIRLTAAAVGGVYADQLAWWPETTERRLNVAVEVKDIAGNTTQLTRQIQVTQTGWKHKAKSTAQITDRSPQIASSLNNRLATSQTNNDQTTHNATSAPPAVKPTPKSKQVGSLTNDNRWNFDQSKSRTRLRDTPAIVSSQQASSEIGRDGSPSSTDIPPVVSPNRSQVWQSDVENWIPQNQTSVSSTIGPDPRIAPDPFPNQLPRQSVTKIPSNSPTMVRSGDRVIGQSSTMGVTNQYRGLSSQNNRKIPKSTLLPGVEGILPDTAGQNLAANKINQQADQAEDSHRQQLSQIEATPQSNFSQTGFGQPKAATNLMPDRETSAPIQIIGSKRFRLNYGIDSIDPSGVARVDLWLTRDGGKSWQTWGSDPDNQSPFPVEIQEEGRYGFRIVVHSRDGLTGQGPSSGDDADMWVLVDTQSPLTRITSVPYGRGREAGRLVINYSVSDKFLTLRPIALAYSPTPQGPWNSIGRGLRNEGRFVWKPTSDVPDQIFLRIEALDKAGNVGVHMLTQAIDVSGLVPRGTIHGVVPVGERSPREQ